MINLLFVLIENGQEPILTITRWYVTLSTKIPVLNNSMIQDPPWKVLVLSIENFPADMEFGYLSPS